MEYFASCNVTYGSTAGNGVLCGSAPIVTSCNNRGIVGSGVFCRVRPESITRVPKVLNWATFFRGDTNTETWLFRLGLEAETVKCGHDPLGTRT
jgi:hypothetical protein